MVVRLLLLYDRSFLVRIYEEREKKMVKNGQYKREPSNAHEYHHFRFKNHDNYNYIHKLTP